MSELGQDLITLAITYGLRVVGVLFALWIAFRLARWLEARIVGTLGARGFDKALSFFFASLVRWGLIAAAVLACLGVFGIETTSFAALLGAAGLAIGLAFQGTLGNFAAGVMLLTFRPFTVGDAVKVAGETGSVVQIGLFVTVLDTFDNRRLVIPNGTIVAGIIENITANPYRRADLDVAVAIDTDIDETRRALEAAAASVEGRDPERGHDVVLLSLSDLKVSWQVRVWCRTEAYWDVYQATLRAVKVGLQRANIYEPIPHMDVTLHQGT